MTSRIIKTASRTIIPFIFLFGFYMILYGHISPGGGFQGGVILAMGAILIFVAYETDTFHRYTLHLSLLELLGITLFLLLGLFGIWYGGSFFSSFGMIWVFNIIIGIKVFAGIVLFYMLLIRWEIQP
jgi:multicomponent Na+:H+ antiporter subunit B